MSTKRVSIMDVAKMAGVSRTVVSRVVNNNRYVSDEKRENIEKVIRELGYRPNAVARSLVNSRSRTIGLCIPYLNSPFIADLMEGVEAEAEKHGYDIFMCHSKEDPEVEREAIDRMVDRQVEGMIIAPVIGGSDAIRESMQCTPTVLFLRRPQGVERNLILAGDYQAARRSIRLLLENGHRRIGIIRGPEGVSTIADRWRGIVDEMREFGTEPDPRLVVSTQFQFQESYDAARMLLSAEERPTAIYSAHYWSSSSLVPAIYDMGLSIPDDISAVAFESFRDWTMTSTLKFATNIFPSIEMGRAAMVELHKLIASGEMYMEKNVVIDPEFFSHNSVKNLNGILPPGGREIADCRANDLTITGNGVTFRLLP